jgi:hypothetical protein
MRWMQGRMKIIRIAAIALALTSSVPAATIVFNGAFLGSQENPPTVSPGIGNVSLSIDDTTLNWTLTGTFSGLMGTTTAAHIHSPAAPGTNAPVLVGLTFSLGVTSGTLSGNGTLSPSNYNNLTAGLFYVNVHTTTNPAGEIRAQLVPETSSAVLGALACLGLLRRRRA